MEHWTIMFLSFRLSSIHLSKFIRLAYTHTSNWKLFFRVPFIMFLLD
jgi:hypothetical protein